MGASWGDPAAGIVAAIDATASRHPDRVAVVDRGRAVPYRTLATASRRAAAWLLRDGIVPGLRVGMTVRDEYAHLVLSLALLRLGTVQATLASHEPMPMRAALAGRLGLAVVLGDRAWDVPEGCAMLCPDVAAIVADAALDPIALPPPAPGRAGFVFPSSGTTGRPKLVLMTEAVLAAQSAITAGIARVRHRLVTNEFSNGKRLQLQTLWIGGTEILVNNGAGRPLAETCAMHGVERMNLAPARTARLAEECARGDAPAWPAATRLMISGGPVPGPVRAALMAHATREVVVAYGCTEAGGMTLAGPDEHGLHPDTVGLPLPGVAVEVVDEDGRRLPPGEPGLVRVRSPGSVPGYLDDPEATARAFRDGWFHPGDAGWMTPGGALVLAGRADDMMNLGTIKIFPAEIEAAAEGFPGLVECAAFALRSPEHGDIPLLAVVAREGMDAAALLAACRDRLGLRAPRRIVMLEALPRNAAGKVLRRELPRAAGLARE